MTYNCSYSFMVSLYNLVQNICSKLSTIYSHQEMKQEFDRNVFRAVRRVNWRTLMKFAADIPGREVG
jgi:hypothetical protein